MPETGSVAPVSVIFIVNTIKLSCAHVGRTIRKAAVSNCFWDFGVKFYINA